MNGILVILLLSLSVAPGVANPQPSSTSDLQQALSQIGNLDTSDPKTLIRIRYTAAYGAKDVQLAALLQLWFRGETTPVELAWWKSTNKNLRTAILAIYLCDRTDDVEWLPDFKSLSQRFSDEERKERLGEIEYVASHRKELAQTLYRFLKSKSLTEHLTENQQTLLSNYKAAAQ